MGTIAARKARDILTLCSKILSIEALCLAQAAELRGVEHISITSQHMVDFVRQYSPFLDEDRPLSEEIEALSDAFSDRDMTENNKIMNDAEFPQSIA